MRSLGGFDLSCNKSIYTSNIPLDITGNGLPDIVTGAWNNNGLYWRENPGNCTDECKEHFIVNVGNVETTRYYYIDVCGMPEIIANCPPAGAIPYKIGQGRKRKNYGTFRRSPHIRKTGYSTTASVSSAS